MIWMLVMLGCPNCGLMNTLVITWSGWVKPVNVLGAKPRLVDARPSGSEMIEAFWLSETTQFAAGRRPRVNCVWNEFQLFTFGNAHGTGEAPGGGPPPPMHPASPKVSAAVITTTKTRQR